MRIGSLSLAVFVVALGLAPGAHAKKYVDTKRRFAVELSRGWRLAPVPGDSSGMTFKRTVDGAFGLFRVQVREAEVGETLEDSLARAARAFEVEIGYRKGAELPTSVGMLPARQRSFTVFASGDKRTVRAVELTVLHAFGHVHVLHFEALRKDRGRFRRGVDRMLGSYQPRVGRRVYAPLIGTWKNLDDGPPLVLSEGMRFSLGPLAGTFRADGGRLVLTVPGGNERYRYQLRGKRLTLRGTNLDGPMNYVRTGSARFAATVADKSARPRALARADLIGRWRVRDKAATEPLVLHLAPTGSVAFGPLSGRWSFKRGLLTIRSTTGKVVTYHVSVDGPRMTLGGGDLDVELRLDKE